MDILTSIASFAQGQLGHSLIFFAVVVAVDIVAGILVAGIINQNFSFRKLFDFTVTTLGWQKTLAFIGALVLMYLHGDQFTQGAVAVLATGYAATVLPDVYDKLSTLLFKGGLPRSRNLKLTPAQKTAAAAS